jgi:hypothetical protein
MRTYLSRSLAGLVVSLVVGGAPGWASEASDLDQHGQAVDRATSNAGSQRVAGRLAAELNQAWGRTPGPYTAESLAAQRAQTGWGWGGVLIGNRLAQHIAESRLAGNPTLTPAEALTQSLAAVTAARQAHTGWGVIAQDNGVKLGPLVSSVRYSTEALTSGLRSPDKPGGKSIDRATTRGPASVTNQRAGAKSDRARGNDGGVTNSFDTGHARGGGAAVSGPGVASGHSSSGRGGSGEGQGGGNSGGGGGHGGGGGQGGGNGGGGGGKGK